MQNNPITPLTESGMQTTIQGYIINLDSSNKGAPMCLDIQMGSSGQNPVLCISTYNQDNAPGTYQIWQLIPNLIYSNPENASYYSGFTIYNIGSQQANKLMSISSLNTGLYVPAILDDDPTPNGNSQYCWYFRQTDLKQGETRNGFLIQEYKLTPYGRVLDTSGQAIDTGTSVILDGWQNFDTQRWIFVPYTPPVTPPTPNE